MAQEGTPRTNVTLDVTSDKQSRDPNKRSTIREDVPRSSASTDKHGKNQVQRRVQKYLKGKAMTTVLKAL